MSAKLTLVYLPMCQTHNATELRRALEGLGISTEALLLKSDSHDKFLDRELADSKSVRTLFVDPNGGLYLALFFAAVYSNSELVACIGGGLEPTAEILQQMVHQATEGYEVVVASRYHSKSNVHYPWKRLVVSRCYSILTSLLLSLGTSDSRSGLKLYRRETLAQALRLSAPRKVALDVELLAYARRSGCSLTEVPVQVEYADSPYSLSLSDMWQGLIDTIRLVYNVRIRRVLQQ